VRPATVVSRRALDNANGYSPACPLACSLPVQTRAPHPRASPLRDRQPVGRTLDEREPSERSQPSVLSYELRLGPNRAASCRWLRKRQGQRERSRAGSPGRGHPPQGAARQRGREAWDDLPR
jgi:hypothetical protein